MKRSTIRTQTHVRSSVTGASTPVRLSVKMPLMQQQTPNDTPKHVE